MTKVTVEEALKSLGEKLGTNFEIESHPDDETKVRLVSIQGHLKTPYTNYITIEAAINYIKDRMDR